VEVRTGDQQSIELHASGGHALDAHVLHLIDTGGPGGAETVFTQLAAGFPRDLGQPLVVVSREGWLAERLRERALSPVVLDPRGSFNLGYLGALLRLIRHHRVHLVVAHLYGSMLYGGIAGRLSGVPVIGVLHGQSDLAGARLAALKHSLLRHGVSHTVFVSEPLRRELNEHLRLPGSRTSVITNAVDTVRFRPGLAGTLRSEMQLPAGLPLVGAVGNVRRPKGYDVLLRAWRALKDGGTAAHLAIVGEGSGTLMTELLALRTALGLERDVTFLGLRSDIVNVLRSLDVLVSSSTTEGFSIVCVEAMACGVPVVATRSGGPESIIEDGVSGILVPVDDPPALADGVRRALLDRRASDALVRAGRELVERNFSEARQLAAYSAIARELLHRAPA
jgi:glycosyltransferase involved in cell wall biosynthesis